MGLKEARDACSDFYKRRDAGLPVATAAPAVHPSKAETVGQLINWYETARAKNPKGTKTLTANLKTLRSCLKRYGKYLDMPAATFSKSDARDIRDKLIVKTPSMSNRFLSYGSSVWAFAAKEDKVDYNVFAAVHRLAGEEPRERVLNTDEITAIWRACEAMKADQQWPQRGAYGRLVQFLLLTGQRRGEAAALRYGDILDGIWFQQQNKASRPHKIKLSPLAMEIVGKGDPRDFVFGISQRWEKRKENIDKLAKVADWRPHDLRRTCATGLQELGVDEQIVRAILNHSISGVSGIYLRAEYVARKGEALQQWADEVQKIVSKSKKFA